MAEQWEVIRETAMMNGKLGLPPQASRIYRSMVKVIDHVLRQKIDPQSAIAASKAAEAALKAIVVGLEAAQRNIEITNTLTAQKGPNLLPYPSAEDLERARNGS
jgi:hypothetical protein